MSTNVFKTKFVDNAQKCLAKKIEKKFICSKLLEGDRIEYRQPFKIFSTLKPSKWAKGGALPPDPDLDILMVFWGWCKCPNDHTLTKSTTTYFLAQLVFKTKKEIRNFLENCPKPKPNQYLSLKG